MPLTWSGQIKDQNGNPVVGMTVRMIDQAGQVEVASDTTDSSGNYSVSDDQVNHVYRVDPEGMPHYSDPGQSSTFEYTGGTQTRETNFTSTYSNANPTRSTVGNQTFEEDDGVKTVTRTMGDPDAGDVLSPIKLSGPSWATLTKVSNTQYRWSFNTATPSPGIYGCSYRIQDDVGGQSPVENFNVEIEKKNQPPTFPSPGTIRFEQSSGLRSFQLEASDPEGGAVTYSKLIGEAWANVDPQTGLVTVGTDIAPQGPFIHTWTATDPEGGETNRSHTIEILDELLIGPYFQVA